LSAKRYKQTSKAMKRLQVMLRTATIILSFYSLSSCYYEITEPFEVTYKVEARGAIRQRMRISYTDSSGYAYLFTDSIWVKKVTLPPGKTAMLSVAPMGPLNMEALLEEPGILRNTKFLWLSQSEIIHNEKTVSEISHTISLLTLTQRGIILEKRKGWKILSPFLPRPSKTTVVASRRCTQF